MAETGSDTRSGIGARLRAGREQMGLTQLQTAEKLHVDPKVVESLEAERFDALGAPVFVRGHLKRYAEFIGEKSSRARWISTGAPPRRRCRISPGCPRRRRIRSRAGSPCRRWWC